MAQKVIAQIVKQKYSPPGRDAYFLAELTLIDSEGREFIESPRRFAEFKAVADLLRREAGVSYEELQNASKVFDAGNMAKFRLTLEDEQIRNLGFRIPQ